MWRSSGQYSFSQFLKMADWIILHCRFSILFIWLLFPLSWWYMRFSLKPVSFENFSYSVLDMSNTSFDDEVQDNVLVKYLRWKIWININIFLVIFWFSEPMVRLSFQIWSFVEKVCRCNIWYYGYWKSTLFEIFFFHCSVCGPINFSNMVRPSSRYKLMLGLSIILLNVFK